MNFASLTPEVQNEIDNLIRKTGEELSKLVGFNTDVIFVAHKQHVGDEPCSGSAVMSTIPPEGTLICLMQGVITMQIIMDGLGNEAHSPGTCH